MQLKGEKKEKTCKKYGLLETHYWTHRVQPHQVLDKATTWNWTIQHQQHRK
jgi:hypothetical protein